MRVPPSAGATCDTSSTEGCLAATTLVRANHAVQGSRGSNRRTMQNHQPWRFPCGAAPARGRVLLCIPPSAGATCDTPSTEGCLATDSRNSDTLCEPQTWLGRGRAAPPGQAELVHILTHISSLSVSAFVLYIACTFMVFSGSRDTNTRLWLGLLAASEVLRTGGFVEL